jgi:hypothetical protein
VRASFGSDPAITATGISIPTMNEAATLPLARSVACWVRRTLTGMRLRRSGNEIAALLPHLLAACAAAAPHLRADAWVLQRIYPTAPDTIVAALGPPRGGAVAVINIPRSDERRAQLARRVAAKRALAALPAIEGWRTAIPRDLAFDIASERPFLLQQHLPGTKLRELGGDDAASARAHVAALTAIGALHRATATQVSIGEGHLRRWIDEPLRLIGRRLRSAGDPHGVDAAAIHALARHLRDVLTRAPVVVSWVHGDFWQENILVNPAGTEVTGIVDWEYATGDALPCFDVVNLLLSRRWLMGGGELGDAVIVVLRAGAWTAPERALLGASSSEAFSGYLGARPLVLLWWLWHVGCSLPRKRCGLRCQRWLARNVASVLREIGRGIPLE